MSSNNNGKVQIGYHQVLLLRKALGSQPAGIRLQRVACISAGLSSGEALITGAAKSGTNLRTQKLAQC